MDQTYLLVLLLVAAVLVAIGAIALARRRPKQPAADGSDSQLAASTEGMKVCPKCGMGNLWTERRCSACGEALRG
jgi:hypothetical protein